MLNHEAVQTAADRLAATLRQMPDERSLSLFLKDLCTPAELLAMAERWRIVRLLHEGASYRDVAEQAEVSVTTVGRVARALQYGSGGYRQALDQQKIGKSDG